MIKLPVALPACLSVCRHSGVRCCWDLESSCQSFAQGVSPPQPLTQLGTSLILNSNPTVGVHVQHDKLRVKSLEHMLTEAN